MITTTTTTTSSSSSSTTTTTTTTTSSSSSSSSSTTTTTTTTSTSSSTTTTSSSSSSSTFSNNQSNIFNVHNLTIIYIFLTGCFPPTITLLPSPSSLSSPLEFRRDQEFYIRSDIQFNCNNSLSTSNQWTIYNCTSTNCTFPIQVDSTVSTTFNEFYVPARTLPLGLYELKLSVVTANLSTLTSSSSAYVRILPAGITANLVPYGTSMITRGYEQDLVLDPGRYSVDLDGDTFNATVKSIFFTFSESPRIFCAIGLEI